MKRPAPTRRGRQRGAAILLAMLILTLVATLAAGMVWLQWRGIEVETAERARSQGEWLLNGALDWARIILRSDARAGSVDHLGEPWAMPLAESRLSDFLATDPNHNSDDSGPEAYLSGHIDDANARYNLAMLYLGQNGRTELVKFQALCTAIGVPVDVATTIFAGLAQSWSTLQGLNGGSAPTDAANSVIMPTEVAQLTWYGIDPAVVRQLQPYVVFIPAATKVNVNTASAEVLMAALPGINRGGAQAVIARRAEKPFTTLADAQTIAGFQPPPPVNGKPAPPPNADVKSDWFEVYGQLRYEQNVLRERSLVHRIGIAQVMVVRRVRLPPDAS